MLQRVLNCHTVSDEELPRERLRQLLELCDIDTAMVAGTIGPHRAWQTRQAAFEARRQVLAHPELPDHQELWDGLPKSFYDTYGMDRLYRDLGDEVPAADIPSQFQPDGALLLITRCRPWTAAFQEAFATSLLRPVRGRCEASEWVSLDYGWHDILSEAPGKPCGERIGRVYVSLQLDLAVDYRFSRRLETAIIRHPAMLAVQRRTEEVTGSLTPLWLTKHRGW